jgi:hypothetical protein
MPPKARADGASRAALNAISVNTSLKRKLADKSENMAPKAKRESKTNHRNTTRLGFRRDWNL